MNKDKNNQKLNRLEESLKEYYSEDVTLSPGFEKKLDSVVSNAISSKKLKALEQEEKKRKSSFISRVLLATKFQIGFLSTLVVVFLAGGISYAAFPKVRENINEAVAPTKGTLYINSTPEDALVELKGEEYSSYIELGSTPLEDKIKAGNYFLKISKEGYKEYTTILEIEVGERSELEVILEKKVSALEKIKQWKTYADLENGFAFTYPLDWQKAEKSTENDYLVKFENTDSSLKVSNNNPSSINLENFVTVEKKYFLKQKNETFTAVKIYNEKKNNLIVTFSTQNEDDLKIFEFILSTFKVYEQNEPSSPNDQMLEYENKNVGVELTYPSEGWIIVETDKYNFTVKPNFEENSSLIFTYSQDFPRELLDYERVEEMKINDNSVSKYKHNSLSDKYIYEFPERVFVKYDCSENLKNDCDNIVDSINLINEKEYETIYDYDLDIAVTLNKNNWEYQNLNQVADLSENKSNRTIKGLSTPSSINIYLWSDIQNQWDEFINSKDLQNCEITSAQVLINNQIYYQNRVWSASSSETDEYFLSFSIYSKEKLVFEEIDSFNPKVKVNGHELLLIYTTDVQVADSLDEAKSKFENIFSKVDAVVSTFKPIDNQ